MNETTDPVEEIKKEVEELKKEVKKWSFSEATMRYITVFLGGGALVVGAFFPWLHSAEVADIESRARAGIGAFAGNIGVLTLILGFLAFAGLYDRPFGLQQRFYSGAIAISSLLVTIGFFESTRNLIDSPAANASLSPGTWITLIGAAVLTLGFLGTLGQEKKTMGKDPRPTQCSLIYIGALAIPAIVATFSLTYDTAATERNAFFDTYREPGVTTTIILVLLLATLFLTIASMTKLRPPATLFMFLTVPLAFITSPFVIRGFDSAAQDYNVFHGGGPGNWLVFICAVFLAVISVRSVRQKAAA